MEPLIRYVVVINGFAVSLAYFVIALGWSKRVMSVAELFLGAVGPVVCYSWFGPYPALILIVAFYAWEIRASRRPQSPRATELR